MINPHVQWKAIFRHLGLNCPRFVLHQVNLKVKHVEYDAFYIPEISSLVDIQEDYTHVVLASSRNGKNSREANLKACSFLRAQGQEKKTTGSIICP